MINVDFHPSAPQALVWDAWDDDDSTSILTGGGVNAGKSYNLMALCITKAIMYAETRYMVGRKTLKSLEGTTQKTFWKVIKTFGLKRDIHYTYNGTSRTVVFFNGSEVIFEHLTYEPADPEIARLGGLELTAAFLDEVGDCDYRVIAKVHERVGRWNNGMYGIKPMVFMTCNPSRGWLKQKYYDLYKAGKQPEWMKVILSTAYENPYAEKAYIKNLINVLTPEERERQLEGNWEFGDDPDQLVKFEFAEAMYYHPIKKEDLKGVKYITADIAFSSDKCVIGVWDDWKLIAIRVVAQNEKPEDIIKQLQIIYGVSGKHVAYDSTGSGMYLKNYIHGAYAFHAGASPLKDNDTKKKTFEHLKTQMYWYLSEQINSGKVIILTEELREELLEEITMIRKYPRASPEGVLKLMSKDDIKKKIGRSPDILDMMSMRGVFDFKTIWKQNF